MLWLLIVSKLTVCNLCGRRFRAERQISVVTDVRHPLVSNVAYAAIAVLELLAHAVCAALAKLKGHSRPGSDRTNAFEELLLCPHHQILPLSGLHPLPVY